MDERVRRTVDTYERIADTYASIHGDREAVADLVERFVAAVDDADTDAGGRAAVETVDEHGAGAAGDRRAGGGSDSATGRPRVLDVGCGPGWESAAFAEAGFDPVSFDLTPPFLDQARERVPDATPVRGDMRALPFADGAFDGLWACASLLHVPEPELPATLADFRRALAGGGVALASLKQAGEADGTGGSPYDGDDRHFERYEPEAAADRFEAAGFDVVDVTTDADEAWVAVTAVAP